jgi:hypothetical protein
MGFKGKLILAWGSLTIEAEKRYVGIETVSEGENVHDFVEVFIRNNWSIDDVFCSKFLFKSWKRRWEKPLLVLINVSDVFNDFFGDNCLLLLSFPKK